MEIGCGRRDLGVLAVSCFLLRLPALVWDRFYDPDEAAIAVQARTIIAGGRLYVDIADRKPPIPPFIYAAWFALTDSNDLRGPRLIASALLAVAAVVLALDVARTHGRRAALWTGALFVLGSFALSPGDGGAANYAHFALPLATLALVACRRGGWWTMVAGLLLGLAILSRQSWVFAIPAAAVSCWMAARLRGVVLFAAGVVAGVASAALYVPWSDYWFWNFSSSPGFVFASIGLGTVFGRGLGALAFFVLLHIALVAGAASILRSSWRTRGDLWLWTITGLAAIAAGFRFYGHYWLQIVTPLAVLSGTAVANWLPRWRALCGATLAMSAVFSVVALCVPTVFRERRNAAPLAAVIRRCTAPSDRIFIWGSFPELYVLADRSAAGGLVHTDFVTGRSGGRTTGTDAATPGAQQRLLADLEAAPPALLVETSGVRDLGYGALPMLTYPAFAEFTRGGYSAQATPDGFTLWWRSPSQFLCASSWSVER